MSVVREPRHGGTREPPISSCVCLGRRLERAESELREVSFTLSPGRDCWSSSGESWAFPYVVWGLRDFKVQTVGTGRAKCEKCDWHNQQQAEERW